MYLETTHIDFVLMLYDFVCLLIKQKVITWPKHKMNDKVSLRAGTCRDQTRPHSMP